jgi:hypothetical protein
MKATKLNSVMKGLNNLIDYGIDNGWSFLDLFQSAKIMLGAEGIEYTIGTEAYLINESMKRVNEL